MKFSWGHAPRPGMNLYSCYMFQTSFCIFIAKVCPLPTLWQAPPPSQPSLIDVMFQLYSIYLTYYILYL